MMSEECKASGYFVVNESESYAFLSTHKSNGLDKVKVHVRHRDEPKSTDYSIYAEILSLRRAPDIWQILHNLLFNISKAIHPGHLSSGGIKFAYTKHIPN